MSTQTSRLLRIVAFTALVTSLLATPGRATAQELDDDTYTDEVNGWSVSFDDRFWEAELLDEENVVGVTFSSDLGYATFRVYDDGITDAQECLDDLDAYYTTGSDAWDDLDPDRRIDPPETDRDAVAELYSGSYVGGADPIDAVFYIECRELDDATLAVDAGSAAETYEDLLPELEDLLTAVEIGGGPSTRDDEPPERDDEDTPEPDDDETPTAEGGLDGNTYVSTEYGWTVEFDDRFWQDVQEIDETGRQGISLGGGDAFVNLIVFPEGEEDPEDCLGDLETVYTAELEDLERSRTLDPPATDRAALGELYTGGLPLDDGPLDVVVYLECREVDGGALTVTATVAEESYEDLLPELEDLLAGIEADSSSADRDEEEIPERDETPATENDLDAGELDGDTFTDTTLGYVLTFDDRTWQAELLEDGATAGVFLSTDDEDLFATVVLDASTGYDGLDPDECVAALADGYGEFDGYTALDEVRNPDGPEAPRVAASAVYEYTVTFVDGTESDLVAYIECRPIDDDTMIRVTIQTTEDSLADNVDVFQELLDGIEIDAGGTNDDPDPGDEETADPDDAQVG